MQTKHRCVLIHICETSLSPPVKYFYWSFQGGTTFVDHLCNLCLVFACGHLLGMGWPLGSRLWCLIVFLSLPHVVSGARCGTWLYWFQIFAAFLTLNIFVYGLSSTKSLFVLMIYIPVNNFSVMLGCALVFLGWKSSKQRIIQCSHWVLN